MLKRIRICILVIAFLFISLPLSVSAVDYDCAAGKHKDTITPTIPATADTDGQAIYTCELCGRSFAATLFATDHVWSDWITERKPTCTENGLRKRTCSKDGLHTETETIPSTGHKYIESIIKEPGCEEPGIKAFHCSVCEHRYTEPYGEPKGHSYIETITTELDCVSNGVMAYLCEHCGDVKDTETITSDGHIFDEWIVDKAAAAGAAGYRHRVCTQCDYVENETLAALPLSNSISNEPKVLPEKNEPLITPVRAAVVGSNMGLIWLFAILIISDAKLIAWDKRKKKENDAKILMEETEDDGYGFS